jgi:hypothetical protein
MLTCTISQDMDQLYESWWDIAQMAKWVQTALTHDLANSAVRAWLYLHTENSLLGVSNETNDPRATCENRKNT